MDVLIAEDDPVSRKLLESSLDKWGLSVLAVADGESALSVLEREDAPGIAILDWMMPRLDGIELCRRLRTLPHGKGIYVILLTARSDPADRVAGLDSGADDYISKPFRRDELHARIRVGQRIVALQRDLSRQVEELEQALARVKQLQGLLPICAYCKNIRNDQNYWQKVEEYVATRTDARFSHGICPACYEQLLHRDGATDADLDGKPAGAF